jgi:hypothetical protein
MQTTRYTDRHAADDSLAIFAAIRRASSLLSSLAAERRPGSSSKINVGKLVPVVIAHDKARVQLLDGPRRREGLARRQCKRASGLIARLDGVSAKVNSPICGFRLNNRKRGDGSSQPPGGQTVSWFRLADKSRLMRERPADDCHPPRAAFELV